MIFKRKLVEIKILGRQSTFSDMVCDKYIQLIHLKQFEERFSRIKLKNFKFIDNFIRGLWIMLYKNKTILLTKVITRIIEKNNNII